MCDKLSCKALQYSLQGQQHIQLQTSRYVTVMCMSCQAFAAAVQQQLRSQSAALQQLPAAVQARRCAELPAVLGKAFPIGGGNSRMTVLEVVLHTQRLQVLQA